MYGPEPITVKGAELVNTPNALLTVISPLVAPAGIRADSSVPSTLPVVSLALTLPNRTVAFAR